MCVVQRKIRGKENGRNCPEQRAALWMVMCLVAGMLWFTPQARAQDDMTCMSECQSAVWLAAQTDILELGDLLSLDGLLQALLVSEGAELSEEERAALNAWETEMDVFLAALAEEVGIELDAVLDAEVTVANVMAAAQTEAAARNNTELEELFERLQADTPSGAFPLSDFIVSDVPAVSIRGTVVASDLVNSTYLALLANRSNVPVELSLPLSVLDVLTDARIRLVVAEPPTLAVGTPGISTRTGSLRLGIELSELDVAIPLNIGDLSLLNARVIISGFKLYLVVGGGRGELLAVDEATSEVRVNGTPVVGEAYIGEVVEDTFFEPTRPFNPETDLIPGLLARARVTLLNLDVLTGDVFIRGTSQDGSSDQLLTFSGPFPELRETAAGGGGIPDLLDFTGDLEIETDLQLLGLDTDLVDDLLNVLLDTLLGTTGTVSDILNGLLVGAVDPLLSTLGLDVGVMGARATMPYAACGDDDGDGIDGAIDNCPCVANEDQDDLDGDGVGDVCDNCVSTGNPDQVDTDADTVGDACDVCAGEDDTIDSDGDGVPDCADRCEGEDDRADMDGDGVPDCLDECPGEDDTVDEDSNGIPDCLDACDDFRDMDGDGVPNCFDVCEGEDDTVDNNGNGVPDCADACEDIADDDGDGVPNCFDICEDEDDRSDVDGDGVADCIDTCDDRIDRDGDGISDCVDNCVTVANPNQTDSDNDTIGDACEDLPNVDLPLDDISGGRLLGCSSSTRGNIPLGSTILMLVGALVVLRRRRS